MAEFWVDVLVVAREVVVSVVHFLNFKGCSICYNS